MPRVQLHRLVPFVCVCLVALAGAAAMGARLPVAAQDPSPGDTSNHPIVGAWWWENLSLIHI